MSYTYTYTRVTYDSVVLEISNESEKNPFELVLLSQQWSAQALSRVASLASYIIELCGYVFLSHFGLQSIRDISQLSKKESPPGVQRAHQTSNIRWWRWWVSWVFGNWYCYKKAWLENWWILAMNRRNIKKSSLETKMILHLSPYPITLGLDVLWTPCNSWGNELSQGKSLKLSNIKKKTRHLWNLYWQVGLTIDHRANKHQMNLKLFWTGRARVSPRWKGQNNTSSTLSGSHHRI